MPAVLLWSWQATHFAVKTGWMALSHAMPTRRSGAVVALASSTSVDMRWARVSELIAAVLVAATAHARFTCAGADPHRLVLERHAEHVDRLEVDRNVRGNRGEPAAIRGDASDAEVGLAFKHRGAEHAREAFFRREAFHQANAVDRVRNERLET